MPSFISVRFLASGRRIQEKSVPGFPLLCSAPPCLAASEDPADPDAYILSPLPTPQPTHTHTFQENRFLIQVAEEELRAPLTPKLWIFNIPLCY